MANHLERMLSNRPAPGYTDWDLADELGVVGDWILLPEWNRGVRAVDQTQQRNHGTLTRFDPATAWQSNGLVFDGVNDYIDCGIQNAVRITGPLTICSMIADKNVLNSGNTGIVSRYIGAGNQRCYTLYIDWQTDSNDIRFRMNISSNGAGAGAVDSGRSTTSPEFGRLYAVCGTFAPSSEIAVWVDGKKETTNTTSIPATIFDGSVNLLIGQIFQDLQKFHAEGPIPMAIIANKTWTEQQIEAYYRDPFRLHRRPTLSVVGMAAAQITSNPFLFAGATF